MKKIIFTLTVIIFFLACEVPYPGWKPVNKYTPSFLKLQYCNNINITNDSSYDIQYRYAPTLRKDYHTLECTRSVREQKIMPLFSFLNVVGTLKKGDSRVLYTGIDGGAYTNEYIHSIGAFPNFNVDGLPARFVVMIDDSICYSLVYDCKFKNRDSELVIDDQLVQKLKAIKPEAYVEGYNSKRHWYGKSVKVADRLYCFEQYDSGKNSMRDYSYIEGKEIKKYVGFDYDQEGLYGKIHFYNFVDVPYAPLYFFDDDDKKCYAVGKGTNPTIEEVK